MTRRVTPLILILIMLLTITGCSGDKTAGKVIGFDIDGVPRNVDPLLAVSQSEIAVAANCFEGLLRLDEKDDLDNGTAESYTVSADKKSYTFHLKRNLHWNDDTPLTAHDYVFGIKRALAPETRSIYAKDLFSIVNAPAYHKGSVSSSALGIKASDDTTLTIQLSFADNEFLRNLTKLAAMPCNEAFFISCKGRYGLEKKYTLSNGPFYVKSWEAEGGKIRLNKNKKYTGETEVKPAAINLSFKNDPDKRVDRIIGDYLDCGFVSGDKIATIKDDSIEKSGTRKTMFYKDVYALYVNPAENDNGDIRKSMLMAVDRDALALNITGSFLPATGMIPTGAVYRGENYRTDAGEIQSVLYDPAKAKTLFSDTLTALKIKKMSFSTLYYPNNESIKRIASLIAQNWQKNLGAYINIEAVAEKELLSGVQTGKYKMALVPLKSETNSALSYLNRFASSSETNLFHINSKSYDKQIAKITGTLTDKEYLSELKKAETQLLSQNYILPVFFSPTAFVSGKKLSGIFYNSNDYIQFISAGKVK